jgi:hypothetical protein
MSQPADRPGACPQAVQEFAAQAVAYVHAAVGMELDYESDTLPVIDHYLRSVPVDEAATVALVIATAGPYFGEVVRRRMGGRWELHHGDPIAWRLVLPTGMSFAPAGLVAAAIARSDDLGDVDTGLNAPPRIRDHLEAAAARMADVTADEYFSLCGRFDTLEHLEEVLIAIAAAKLAAAAKS